MIIPIIIPTYQKPYQLQKCLQHIAQQTIPCTPIIEDNNDVNRGYTRAVNDGLRKVGAEHPYAITMNQDAYLYPDCVQRMIEFMDAHPRCAIAGIKQVLESDPDFIWHGGGGDILPSGQHFMGRISEGTCAESKPVVWVNGACQIVRMSALAEIGLMDEAMFLIGSDADWCIAASIRGWEVWYIAEAVCSHEVGVSLFQWRDDVTLAMVNDMNYLTGKLGRITGHDAARHRRCPVHDSPHP